MVFTPKDQELLGWIVGGTCASITIVGLLLTVTVVVILVRNNRRTGNAKQPNAGGKPAK